MSYPLYPLYRLVQAIGGDVRGQMIGNMMTCQLVQVDELDIHELDAGMTSLTPEIVLEQVKTLYIIQDYIYHYI